MMDYQLYPTFTLFSSAFNNVFNRTLAGLAFFDGIFNLCDILESVRKIYYDMNSCLPWSYFKIAHIYIFPKVLYPLHKIAMTTSMYTTVVLAFNRYSAVSKPISVYVNSATGTSKRVLINIFLVFLFAVLFNLPKFLEFYVEWCTRGCMEGIQMPVKTYDAENETFDNFKTRLYEFGINNSFTSNVAQMNNSIEVVTTLRFGINEFRVHPNYIMYYINISQNLVTGFIPLILLGILNLGVYLHLRKRRKEVAQLAKGILHNFSLTTMV